MTGRHKGVLGLLHQEHPQIIGIGCVCHLSALAAKHGSKALKHFNPEDFIIDIYYHFEKR
jgi:flagellar motor switch protein FliG